MARKIVLLLAVTALGCVTFVPIASAQSESSPASVAKAKKKKAKKKKAKKQTKKKQTKSQTIVLPNPKGDKGDRGDAGARGEKGEKGDAGNGSDIFERADNSGVALAAGGLGSTVVRLGALDPGSYTFNAQVSLNAIGGGGEGEILCNPYIEPTGFLGSLNELAEEFRNIDEFAFEIGTTGGRSLTARQSSQFSRTITTQSDAFVQCGVPSSGTVAATGSITALKVNSITRR